MKALTKDEIAGYLALNLKDWTFEGNAIKRDFKIETFVEAFSFMTAIALVLEKIDHHPDWSNSYNKVSIVLSTHSAKGITHHDIDLAEKIDGTYKRYAQ
ncbi:4a-hydroxytetrahydrobiopterin dehydratase [Williamwhitmania taraxaci]|uniref:Putative pterin-4-alpha-carbinolamine dehydratase n=1 Tax=Williamwhitmania taraxaci TaxID=1640674 RepID=A0A1G6SV80_9BACT|nr:4a-hydroxytetrahydrobiopterin dehydratase [Williamwhitmania taraxaci]SDD20035.1 pterin-4-alpha-carbinolamine dehydratase [Williamwhitmania taraxaci]